MEKGKIKQIGDSKIVSKNYIYEMNGGTTK